MHSADGHRGVDDDAADVRGHVCQEEHDEARQAVHLAHRHQRQTHHAADRVQPHAAAAGGGAGEARGRHEARRPAHRVFRRVLAVCAVCNVCARVLVRIDGRGRRPVQLCRHVHWCVLDLFEICN